MLVTRSRARLYEMLASHFPDGARFDAETIYRVMDAMHERVAVSTIHHTLREFERQGLLRLVRPSGRRKTYQLRESKPSRAPRSRGTQA